MIRLSFFALALLLGLSCEPSSPGSCCKVCSSQSKACGDSCISSSKTCNAGYGCACNDRDLDDGESGSSDSEG